VSWHLNSKSLGKAPRSEHAKEDTELPDDLDQASRRDYQNSDYEEGHLCDAESRTRSAQASQATFLMTNMAPQKRELNRGPWKGLETYSHELAVQGKELYIVAGPLFADKPPVIGSGVAVPRAFYKIVVVLEKGQGLESVTDKTPVIAVIMPNKASVKSKSWSSFMVEPREVEQEAGYSFLTGLGPRVHDALVGKKLDSLP
jgi:endonuclease G